MSEETNKAVGVPREVMEQIEKLLSEVSAVKDFATQAFTARQGFYEKLVLLNGATLTLFFTVTGGLSHAALNRGTLERVSGSLFIGCWLFILSIMLSLLHNHLNIATLIHMSGSLTRTAAHGRRVLLGVSLRGVGIASKFDGLPAEDPEAANDLKKGKMTENAIRWIGPAAQAATIFGYVAFVSSLQAVIHALSTGAH